MISNDCSHPLDLTNFLSAEIIKSNFNIGQEFENKLLPKRNYVWFSFVANSPDVFIKVESAENSKPILYLIDNQGDCSKELFNFFEKNCFDDKKSKVLLDKQGILNIGKKYYIAVTNEEEYNDAFTIKIKNNPQEEIEHSQQEFRISKDDVRVSSKSTKSKPIKVTTPTIKVIEPYVQQINTSDTGLKKANAILNQSPSNVGNSIKTQSKVQTNEEKIKESIEIRLSFLKNLPEKTQRDLQEIEKLEGFKKEINKK
ncbi:MAG: hypothetical protein KA010_03800 [Saprospiraceae bacterium]|nr:hypothetical protein [Saprospiraceae bacterium]